MSKLSWASQYSQYFKKLSDFQKYLQFHPGVDLFPKYYLVSELQLVSQNWNFFTKELFSEKNLVLENWLQFKNQIIFWKKINAHMKLRIFLKIGQFIELLRVLRGSVELAQNGTLFSVSLLGAGGFCTKLYHYFYLLQLQSAKYFNGYLFQIRITI